MSSASRTSGPSADEEPDDDPPERDARPPVTAVVASLLAAVVSFAAAVVAAPTGGAIVGLAAVGFALGSILVSERVLVWAAVLGIVGLAVAGYAGAAPEPLLVAAAALAVAWDVGDHGLSLGRHVGREASTRRNVAVHAGGTALVGGLSVGIVYVTYVLGAGGQPVAALAFLLFGAIVLASALR